MPDTENAPADGDPSWLAYALQTPRSADRAGDGQGAGETGEVVDLPTQAVVAAPAGDVSDLPTAHVRTPPMEHAQASTGPACAGSSEPPRPELPSADDTPTLPFKRATLPPDTPPAAPPPSIGAHVALQPAPRRKRTGPKALLLSLLVATVLLVVAAVPILRLLQPPAPTTGDAAPTPTLAPSASATATPGHPDPNAYNWVAALRAYAERKYVDGLIQHMTLDEEIGQMIQVSFFNDKQPTPAILDEIASDHIGSVILYDNNLSSADVAKQWTSQLQSAAKIPLLIGTDEEGGAVNRLSAIYGDMTSAWEMAARNDPAFARQTGEQFRKDLYALGMNSDYAPVVDVDSGVGAAGGELNGRMFGNNPGQVTSLAGAFMQGLQDGNQVAACLKHFPGLGDAQADPHSKLYTINRSLDDLWRVDWAPYKALIATGHVGMIMSTHVIIAAVDPTRPASLSRPVITGILRGQLHYDGVIITDGVYMLQKQGSYTYDQSVMYAVEAGNDIVSAAYSRGAADEALSVIRQGVQGGAISKQQIDNSVRRILLLKLHYGLLTVPQQ